MEVKENQVPAELLDQAITACMKLKELMDNQELKTEINEWIPVSETAAKTMIFLTTGHTLSGWKKAIGKLTERLEAMQHSNEKAQKTFKSRLSSRIKKIKKLSNFCQKMVNQVQKANMNQHEKDKMYLPVVMFHSYVTSLLILLVEIQDALRMKKR